jgi:type III secretion protein V
MLFGELGLLLQVPAVVVDRRLAGTELRVQVNDLRWPPIDGLAEDEWLVDAPPEDLEARGIAAAGARHPLTGVACSRVAGGGDRDLERCREIAATLGSAGFVVACLRAMARRHAGHLLTTETVGFLLDLLDDTEPALVRAAGGRFDTTTLTWILRDLVRDGVSIRDFRNVIEGLLTLEGSRASARARPVSSFDVAYWSDWTRASLRRQITRRHVHQDNHLGVHLLAADLEARIAASERLPLSEPERQRLLSELLEAQASSPTRPLVILTTQEVRRRLQRLVDRELPRVAVIAYQELSPDVDIRPYGRIGERWPEARVSSQAAGG